MPVFSSDLQQVSAPGRLAVYAPWTRQKRAVWQVPASGQGGARQALRLDQLPGFSRIEEFEEHLATTLASGVCVFFDGTEPLLLSGQAPAGTLGGLRIVIGPDDLGASRFHILGPGVDASFAMADGAFLAGEADRRRTALIRYWYRHAQPHLIRVWNGTRSLQLPANPIGAA